MDRGLYQRERLFLGFFAPRPRVFVMALNNLKRIVYAKGGRILRLGGFIMVLKSRDSTGHGARYRSSAFT
jgi:hypothetical protein